MDKERKLEEEILASFERGEWKPSRKVDGEIARFAAMASVLHKYDTGGLVEPTLSRTA